MTYKNNHVDFLEAVKKLEESSSDDGFGQLGQELKKLEEDEINL